MKKELSALESEMAEIIKKVYGESRNLFFL